MAHPVRGFPRLLGDIGGTNARWAWQAEPAAALGHFGAYRCAEFASPAAVVRRYLAERSLPVPAAVAFGIATPVAGDAVRMTNHAWAFSIEALRRELGVERCLVLNDFAAIAAGLPRLGIAERRQVGGGQALDGEPIAVLGPGTGLGVASLVGATGAAPRVVPGEGGHATLAAADARDAAVLERLRVRFGHVSAERAVSGPGLAHLHAALTELAGRPVVPSTPAEVVERALAGDDPDSVEALRLFCGFLGNVAGNLALTLGARGGVYLAGGILPRLGAPFDASPFRERFEAKGRFRSYLEAIPTYVITAPAVALYGAAAALDGVAG